MPRGTYVPNDTLLSLLKAQGKKTFKVTTIRDLFIESSIGERDANELRRWVNGQFKTLTKHGYIKIVSQSGVRTDFKITAKLAEEKQDKTTSTETSIVTSEQPDILTILKTRLHNCKIEMLTSSGETKEYEELSKLFPNMHKQLQKKFNVAKEVNIEYIGRVKALELLIAECS
ncbi:hypothetical protein [Paraglaciecola sp.]|uniref:hypothetical protein n=1 Tax=Paraglaciecola sp. TaxID=1920173 RepID=UPI003EFA98D2